MTAESVLKIESKEELEQAVRDFPAIFLMSSPEELLAVSGALLTTATRLGFTEADLDRVSEGGHL